LELGQGLNDVLEGVVDARGIFDWRHVVVVAVGRGRALLACLGTVLTNWKIGRKYFVDPGKNWKIGRKDVVVVRSSRASLGDYLGNDLGTDLGNCKIGRTTINKSGGPRNGGVWNSWKTWNTGKRKLLMLMMMARN
jgi:hypothetical protein